MKTLKNICTEYSNLRSIPIYTRFYWIFQKKVIFRSYKYII